MNQWEITQGDINFGEYGGYATRQCEENGNEFEVMEVVPASEKPMAMVRYDIINISEDFEISSEVLESMEKPVEEMTKAEKAVAVMQTFYDIGEPRLISCNELMDFFAMHRFEEAYEQSKEIYIPEAKNVLSEESDFETVVFDKENIEYLSEDELLDIDENLKVNYDSYSVSEPNYYGTGNINIQLTFTKDELDNLTSRNEEAISQEELDELFDFGNDCYYFAHAEISAIDKKISVEISLYMANRNLSLEIPLKEGEVSDLFDLMNSVVKDAEGKDLHDMIREIRKGAERDPKERIQNHGGRGER